MGLDIQSLSQFRAYVIDGSSLVAYPDGSWAKRWEIDVTARRALKEQFGTFAPDFEKEDALTSCRFFCRYLHSREVKRGAFKTHFNTPSLDEISQTCQAIQARLKKFIDQEKEALAKLKARRAVLQSELNDLPRPPSPAPSPRASFPTVDPEARRYKVLEAEIAACDAKLASQVNASDAIESSAELNRALIGLKYRALSQKQIEALAPEEHLARDRFWLKEAIVHWKKQQFPFITSEFTEDELKKVDETLLYPELIALFKENQTVLEDYIAFVFRNTVQVCEDAVKIAVQFPSLQEQITSSVLDKRIKCLRNYGLLFHEETKDVTFLINGKHVSILDQTKKISFDSETTLSIRAIFAEFAAKKASRMGRFEYLADGICLAETQFPKVNLESADWWKELLEFETLTKKQVEERYKVQIKEGESLIVLNASRQHTYLRSDNNHSWFVVVTKKENEKGEDKYHVLPMGKYATYYAQNDLELFFFIFGTQPASICYPDENMFYYHREKCNLPLVAKPHHFSRFMDKVRRDMILAKEGKLYFQSQGNNCATWLQETLDYAFEGQVLPRFFEIDVLETTGPFPVNKIISTLNSIKQATAHSVANVCRILFCTAFGAAWQGYSPEWSNKTYRFIPIEELNRALDALYKIALYAYQLATHRLLGTQDPSIRLKDNATWLEGKLLLPSYLFHTASEYRRALSPAST